MSAFKRFFTGVTDTGENAKEERLRTRYYRSEPRKVCQTLTEFVKNNRDLTLVHTNDARGEVMAEYRSPLGLKHDVVITVITVTPVQSAVDIHAALRSTFVDLGFNAKLISRIYRYLDEQLTPIQKNRA